MDIFKKAEWIIGIIIILLCGFISVGFAYGENIKTTSPIVVVDPGHGGIDPGKIGVNGKLEKDINLAIAKHLRQYLHDAGYTVIMTRTEDKGLYSKYTDNKKRQDLYNRCKIINRSKAMCCLSIHQNSYTDSSVRGAQVFYYSGSSEGKTIAGFVQKSLSENLGNDYIRPVKADDSYYMLRHSTCPTIIIECGFLSNYTEASALSSEEYQKKAALAIYTGFSDYMNVRFKHE